MCDHAKVVWTIAALQYRLSWLTKHNTTRKCNATVQLESQTLLLVYAFLLYFTSYFGQCLMLCCAKIEWHNLIS